MHVTYYVVDFGLEVLAGFRGLYSVSLVRRGGGGCVQAVYLRTWGVEAALALLDRAVPEAISVRWVLGVQMCALVEFGLVLGSRSGRCRLLARMYVWIGIGIEKGTNAWTY